MFDINDFDETLPGPWEWDVKRLAASMIIAARDNGFGAKDQDKIVLDTVNEYRTAMRTFAGMGNLEVWYAHLEIESVLEQFRSQVKARSGQTGRGDRSRRRTRATACPRSRSSRSGSTERPRSSISRR